MKMLILALFVAAVCAQTTCTFEGCDCTAGTSCTIDGVVNITGTQRVDNGNVVIGSGAVIVFDFPTSSIDVDGTITIASGSVATLSPAELPPYPETTLLKGTSIGGSFGKVNGTVEQCSITTEYHIDVVNVTVTCNGELTNITSPTGNLTTLPGNGANTSGPIWITMATLLLLINFI